MTNNLKMINRLTELMNEIDTIKEEIKEIILKLEVDPIPEAVTMYDTSKNILCTNVINKFLRENGTLLNKELQRKLFSKITYCNVNRLKLSQLLNFLEFKHEYIDNGTEWRDLRIEIKDIKKKQKNK